MTTTDESITMLFTRLERYRWLHPIVESAPPEVIAAIRAMPLPERMVIVRKMLCEMYTKQSGPSGIDFDFIFITIGDAQALLATIGGG